MAIAPSIAASCWLAAASQYGLPVELLQCIGKVESSFNPAAIAYAPNGTWSLGVMQVNSSWFPTLEKHGITVAQLYNMCVNIKVGTWIFAQEVQRYGHSWEAIGAYYAGAYSAKSMHWKLPLYREYATKVLACWTDKREEAASAGLRNSSPK